MSGILDWMDDLVEKFWDKICDFMPGGSVYRLDLTVKAWYAVCLSRIYQLFFPGWIFNQGFGCFFVIFGSLLFCFCGSSLDSCSRLKGVLLWML